MPRGKMCNKDQDQTAVDLEKIKVFIIHVAQRRALMKQNHPRALPTLIKARVQNHLNFIISSPKLWISFDDPWEGSSCSRRVEGLKKIEKLRKSRKLRILKK
jgi:hypothetical protein